jgi:hypothetical protein
MIVSSLTLPLYLPNSLLMLSLQPIYELGIDLNSIKQKFSIFPSQRFLTSNCMMKFLYSESKYELYRKIPKFSKRAQSQVTKLNIIIFARNPYWTYKECLCQYSSFHRVTLWFQYCQQTRHCNKRVNEFYQVSNNLSTHAFKINTA